MRVIGGEYKSRRIKFPKGKRRVRPTKDRVREAIFNIISRRIRGSRIIDLYAGSGALGIEALSRGAEKAVFVDEDTGCAKTIVENLITLNVSREKSSVLRMRVENAVRKLAKNGEKFDIAFLDPPYRRGMAKQCLIIICKYGILMPKSLVIVEHHKDDELIKEESCLFLKVQKKYGDTAVSVLEFHENHLTGLPEERPSR